MKKYTFKLFVLTAFMLLTWFNSRSFAQACERFFVPPSNVNGLEITETHTGSVGTYGSSFTSCSVTSAPDAAWLGSSGPFSYTLHFSAPVRQITMQVTATGNPGEESFTFTTNNGKPVITTNNSCYTKIVGNQIFSGLDSPGNGGGGIFVIKNPSDFTELTITGNGGLNGSLFSFCANFVKGSCKAGSLAPTLKESRAIIESSGPGLKLADVPALNQSEGFELTWHTSTPATRSNQVWAENVKEGTYYAAFYYKKDDCFSTEMTKLEVVAKALPGKLDEVPIENFDAALFKPVNVVFVLDISNSMEANGKLNLLKQSVGSLLDIIRPEDKVALVTYASQASVIMSSSSGSSSEAIRKKVDGLRSMGSTAGLDGIKLGFREAKRAFIKEGTNLVIVVTDGAFNENMGDYLGVIEKYQDQGIKFSVVGVKNNPKDEANMREAAEHGKGSYVPVFKASDTKENLILEIKKHAFKL